jgi:hypothetical protein
MESFLVSRENTQQTHQKHLRRPKGISSGAMHFSVRVRPFASALLVEINRASVCVGGDSSGTTHFFWPNHFFNT